MKNTNQTRITPGTRYTSGATTLSLLYRTILDDCRNARRRARRNGTASQPELVALLQTAFPAGMPQSGESLGGLIQQLDAAQQARPGAVVADPVTFLRRAITTGRLPLVTTASTMVTTPQPSGGAKWGSQTTPSGNLYDAPTTHAALFRALKDDLAAAGAIERSQMAKLVTSQLPTALRRSAESQHDALWALFDVLESFAAASPDRVVQHPAAYLRRVTTTRVLDAVRGKITSDGAPREVEDRDVALGEDGDSTSLITQQADKLVAAPWVTTPPPVDPLDRRYRRRGTGKSRISPRDIEGAAVRTNDFDAAQTAMLLSAHLTYDEINDAWTLWCDAPHGSFADFTDFARWLALCTEILEEVGTTDAELGELKEFTDYPAPRKHCTCEYCAATPQQVTTLEPRDSQSMRRHWQRRATQGTERKGLIRTS